MQFDMTMNATRRLAAHAIRPRGWPRLPPRATTRRSKPRWSRWRGSWVAVPPDPAVAASVFQHRDHQFPLP